MTDSIPADPAELTETLSIFDIRSIQDIYSEVQDLT